MRILSLFIFLSLLVMSCSDESKAPSEYLISSTNKETGSTTSGNLVTTALLEVNDLDIVFYPTAFLDENKFAIVKLGMNSQEIQNVLSLYPTVNDDQFRIGTMKGSNIKEFILQRTRETYSAEMQVAGLRYDVRFTGGVPTIHNVVLNKHYPLDEDRMYRVALSETFFFNGRTLPGYLFRNNMNFNFNQTRRNTVSARKSIEKFLNTMSSLPNLNDPRVVVKKFVRGQAGFKTIPEIQSEQHHSPLYGFEVTTEGVVTNVGVSDYYPRNLELFIQDPKGDGNDKTSDAININLGHLSKKFNIGDKLRVTGVVYEHSIEHNELTQTGIRDISNIEVLATNQKLPAPVKLGSDPGRRPIPQNKISTFNNNLNLKPYLDLNDGADFWESLESMRVEILNPRVTGFNGGKTMALEPRNFLNIFVRPDGHKKSAKDTNQGGVYINADTLDFNPHVLNLAQHRLSSGINRDTVYNVGDLLKGTVEGVLSFETNFFGDGYFTLLMPKPQTALTNIEKVNRLAKCGDPSKIAQPGRVYTLEQRLDTCRKKLVPTKDQLTVTTYNVQNLAGFQKSRIRNLAQATTTAFHCPDILNLVEIQDFNGQGLAGDSSAEITLQRLLSSIKSRIRNNKNAEGKKEKPLGCEDVEYKTVNIDPFLNGEGGQPGGNIRVSMIYNSKRVTFKPVINNDPLAETLIQKDGSLSHNPGRVYPNNDAFFRTRKSLVAEFGFKGERVIVIGNHFNSKLGDTSLWTAQQPAVFRSDQRRSQLAYQINEFSQRILLKDPKANILVVGDFNAYYTEIPMKILEGDILNNLIYLLDKEERYTTSHDGNSQALDYIFVNDNLMKKKPETYIPHINSDFMGKFSDHDPVMSRFTFK